jgi:precorrin-2 dehydrogenase/sirohydrochlorin ferrochelatase
VPRGSTVPLGAPLYPVGLVVDGRRVLVVGGGAVAARKVAGLAACGARVHVVAPAVADEIRRTAGVTWEERPYRRGEVVGYRLVFAATDDPEVNAAVFADAEAAGVWVNAADDPSHCTVVLPSVLRRGSITVAVATGGESPGLAAWLRRRLEEVVGPEYETLLELVAEARREVRRSGTPTASLDWQSVLDSGILEMIRAGRISEARERLRTWL